jgi:hypothetical protein
MSKVFKLNGATRHDPAVEAWFAKPALDLDAALPEPVEDMRQTARLWFDRMRACGPDVLELIHDGCPVACVADAPFGYVNVFKAHVNVGFFQGAALDDREGLLEGAGKSMRHVKLRSPQSVNAASLGDLIAAAYQDIRRRLSEGA